jgi:hypothetical protein
MKCQIITNSCNEKEPDTTTTPDVDTPVVNNSFVSELIQQNQSLQDSFNNINQNGNTIVTNTTRTNNYNINVYLKENISEAKNFMDLIDRVEVLYIDGDSPENSDQFALTEVSKKITDSIKDLALQQSIEQEERQREREREKRRIQ